MRLRKRKCVYSLVWLVFCWLLLLSPSLLWDRTVGLHHFFFSLAEVMWVWCIYRFNHLTRFCRSPEHSTFFSLNETAENMNNLLHDYKLNLCVLRKAACLCNRKSVLQCSHLLLDLEYMMWSVAILMLHSVLHFCGVQEAVWESGFLLGRWSLGAYPRFPRPWLGCLHRFCQLCVKLVHSGIFQEQRGLNILCFRLRRSPWRCSQVFLVYQSFCFFSPLVQMLFFNLSLINWSLF